MTDTEILATLAEYGECEGDAELSVMKWYTTQDRDQLETSEPEPSTESASLWDRQWNNTEEYDLDVEATQEEIELSSYYDDGERREAVEGGNNGEGENTKNYSNDASAEKIISIAEIEASSSVLSPIEYSHRFHSPQERHMTVKKIDRMEAV